MRSLSHFGPVSTDQEMQTARQPEEAMTLSEPLTLIWSKGGERKGGDTCTWKMNSSVTQGIFDFQRAMFEPC